MAFTDFSNDHLVGIIVFASVMATLGLQILLESVRQLLSKMVQLKGNPQTNSAYLIKLELLVAKNLIAANLNGTSDPYAIITCGTEKRFRFRNLCFTMNSDSAVRNREGLMV
ncbi:uncharacterized protein LOC111987016 isoform X5 [Quercus suber]|uniref:uncharacterized protein LOC111987016 isoform X5 n=1 Tax=Quercus suber TaxID=58331 RepID=UPI0032DFC6A8